jgi:hypothetical protein
MMLVFYQTVKSRQFTTREPSEAYCLSMVDFRKPLFDPGACAATPAALDAIEEAGLEFMELLNRHVTGDWGDLDEHDNQANETALECGSRILSYYRLPTGQAVYIITDAKGEDGCRRTTTIMLREEY